MHLKENNTGKIFLLPYAVTSGGSPVAADGYGTFSGTATASGTGTVSILNEDIVFPIATGQTPTQIGAVVAGAINARTYFPLTASNNSGQVLLTAKTLGASQGDGTTGVIRFRFSVQPQTGVSVSQSGNALGLGAGAHAGVDGSITESANFLAALSIIDSKRYYYMVTTLWDSTSLAGLKTDLLIKEGPLNGNRSVGITAFTGLAATAQATAVSLNYARLQIASQPNSGHDVAELAAWVASTRQREEAGDAAFNFNGIRSSNLKAVYASTDFLSLQNMSDMITDGVTPIGSDANGGFLVKSVSTRSKNSGGSVEDTRAAETSRPSVCDQFVDDAQNEYIATYGSFKAKDDVRTASGDIDTTVRVPKGVLTPSRLKPLFVGLLRQYDKAGLLRNVDTSVASLDVHLSALTGGRFIVNLEISVIEWANQLELNVSEVSSN